MIKADAYTIAEIIACHIGEHLENMPENELERKAINRDRYSGHCEYSQEDLIAAANDIIRLIKEKGLP